jgi:hypothetical protein
MRSTDIQNQLPKVSADQLELDRTLKHLRKLRWIGKEREAQKIFQALGDIRLHPSLPVDWSGVNHSGWLTLKETWPSELGPRNAGSAESVHHRKIVSNNSTRL